VDWWGTLTKDPSDWLRSPSGTEDKCLHYLVSDADIYVAGYRGEQWYELARDLVEVQLVYDGIVIKTSTVPEGDFCINTRGTYNGKQIVDGARRLEVRAVLSNPTRSVRAVNENLRVDNTPPTGYLVAPEDYVRGTVPFKGHMEDAHSGTREWRFEVLPPGGTWRHVCTGSPVPDAPGRYECGWNSANGQFADGTYQVRATMVDRASDGGNASTTAHVTVDVANADPPDDGGTTRDTVDQAFDADWEETGPPETAFENVGTDDLEFNNSQADDDHGGAYAVICASDDEWGVSLAPTYLEPAAGALPLNLGPEAALVSFVGNVAPSIPATAFQQAERTSEFVIYVARSGSAVRAFVVVENEPALGWVVSYFEGCSGFPEELAPVGLP